MKKTLARLLICLLTFPAAPSYFGTVKISDGTTTAGVDSATGTLQTISLEHHEIHEGEHFACPYTALDCDAGATLGNMMYAQVVGTDGTTPTGNQGGQTDRNHEMILKQNTFYTVEFRAQTNDTRLSFVAHFYEE